MKPRKKTKTALLSAAIIIALMYQVYKNQSFTKDMSDSQFAEQTNIPSELYTVERVVDGDTLKVNIDGHTITVRLIGIDTPESVHPDDNKNTVQGEIASDYVKELLACSSVQLEYDTEKYDKYERVLAYIYLEDGTMLNALLLQEGYAKTLTVETNTKYEEYFSRLQEKTKAAEEGFWSTGE